MLFFYQTKFPPVCAAGGSPFPEESVTGGALRGSHPMGGTEQALCPLEGTEAAVTVTAAGQEGQASSLQAPCGLWVGKSRF